MSRKKVTQADLDALVRALRAEYPYEWEDGKPPTDLHTRLDWDWPGKPTPTILWEGGPYEWAYDESDRLQQAAAKRGLWVEPYASYALCVYPA